MNLLPVRVAAADPAGVRVTLPGGGEVVVPVDGARTAPGASVTLGIRPEALKPGADGALSGEVSHVERLGGLTLAHVSVADVAVANVSVADGATVVAQIEGSAPVRTGESIRLTIDPAATHLFDGEGRALPHRARHPLAA
ncbi:TOBE domain-containing protein [Methylobacterium tarhaniae]|uniref:TOBE domain-containing protein n=1 Tax=Methylobacterium tarhaniae TaxID=1187852 RepID=UPI00069D6AD7|nr:TOBE domain-containing protein [Methylobacterium tarhaniae]